MEVMRGEPNEVKLPKGGVIFHRRQRRSQAEILDELNAINEYRQNLIQADLWYRTKEQQEGEQELSIFGLICLILGEFFKGAANAMVGDEFEQIGMKNKEATNNEG